MGSLDFQYYPSELDFSCGEISVSTLPGLTAKVAAVDDSDCVDDRWHYGNRAGKRRNGEAIELPYRSRLFSLPTTHRVSHAGTSDPEHLAYLVWCLGFLHGMRFTSVVNGYLDSTPLTHKLVDFIVRGNDREQALAAIDEFWSMHQAASSMLVNAKSRPRALVAAIHNLFLAQRRHLLSYEKFIWVQIPDCMIKPPSSQPGVIASVSA